MTVDQQNPHSIRPRSVAMVRIGTEDYPMVAEPTCATCQSPHRHFIENELLRGRSYRRVADQVSQMPSHGEDPPSYRSLARHVEHGHLPQPAITRRRIMEDRAQQVGIRILDDDTDLIDYVVVNDLIINRGLERLMAGEIEPGINDLMQAIKFKNELEKTSEDGYDQEATQAAFMEYFHAIEKHMPQQLLDGFYEDLKRNPILNALMAGVRASDVVQGEVEEVPVDSSI